MVLGDDFKLNIWIFPYNYHEIVRINDMIPIENDVIENKSKQMDMQLLFLQTIGMFAVVLGHYNGITNAVNTVFPYYTWHIPFFVFISGILFARKFFHKSFFDYFNHKIITLLIPALFINLCYGIISIVMRHYNLVKYGSDISLNTIFFYFSIHAWLSICQ